MSGRWLRSRRPYYSQCNIPIYFVLVFFLVFPNAVGIKVIKQISPCKAETDQGMVDLGLLSTKPPSIIYVDTLLTYTYNWDPCSAFTIKAAGGTSSTCKSVIACLTDTSNPPAIAEALSEGTSVTWGPAESKTGFNASTLQIKMSGTGASGAHRTFYVLLICDKAVATHEERAISFTGPTDFGIQLRSKHSCLLGGPSGSSGLSIGSYMLIGLVSVVFLYIVVGILVMKYVKKAPNGIDLIPNRVFWISIPFLVKDGVVFVVRRGTRKGYESK